MSCGPGACENLLAEAARQLRQYGVFAPFDVVPPFPTAVAAIIGSPFDVWSDIAIFFGSVALCAVAVYGLLRPFGRTRACLGASTAALAPSHWPVFVVTGGIDQVMFWAFVVAAISLRKRPVWFAASALAALLSRRPEFSPVDLFGAAEIAALSVIVFTEGKMRALGVATLAAVFVGGSLFAAQLLSDPRSAPDGMSLRSASNPVLLQAHGLVFSDSHSDASLLWLRALATDFADAPCAKFQGRLQVVIDARRTCTFDLPDNSARAVLVSRKGFEELRSIRGLLDVEGLERYVRWANRPESVAVERSGANISLSVEGGEHDVILLRENWSPGWTISPSTAKLLRDPVGFIVIDPVEPGKFEAVLTRPRFTVRSRSDELRLTMDEFPVITPESAIDALTFERGPFRPGQYITIFGRNFNPNSTSLRLGDEPLEPMWVGETQINFQLPENASGTLELRAVAAGRESYPEPIEIQP